MNKVCELCNKNHNGNYGSGRFCSQKCSRCFSTKVKRTEINLKVSKTLKESNRNHDKGFVKGFDKRRKLFTKEEQLKGTKIRLENLKKLYEILTWDELPLPEKRRRIKQEQKNVCLHCNQNTWMGKKLVLELHHIDGDKQNNKRDNLCFLCPNCHSFTPNYKSKNKRPRIPIGRGT